MDTAETNTFLATAQDLIIGVTNSIIDRATEEEWSREEVEKVLTMLAEHVIRTRTQWQNHGHSWVQKGSDDAATTGRPAA